MNETRPEFTYNGQQWRTWTILNDRIYRASVNGDLPGAEDEFSASRLDDFVAQVNEDGNAQQQRIEALEAALLVAKTKAESLEGEMVAAAEILLANTLRIIELRTKAELADQIAVDLRGRMAVGGGCSANLPLDQWTWLQKYDALLSPSEAK